MSNALDEYRSALERLRTGRPREVPKGTAITSRAVAFTSMIAARDPLQDWGVRRSMIRCSDTLGNGGLLQHDAGLARQARSAGSFCRFRWLDLQDEG